MKLEKIAVSLLQAKPQKVISRVLNLLMLTTRYDSKFNKNYICVEAKARRIEELYLTKVHLV